MGKVTEINNDFRNNKNRLWRYMDIYGFLSLIVNNEINFTRLSKFDDGFEGQMPIKNAVTCSADFEANEYFTRDVEEVRQLTEHLRCVRQNTWVSSWQLIDSECALMWRAYGTYKNGIAIQTIVDKLVNALDSSYDYTIGSVRYIDYLHDSVIDEDNAEAFSFHKQNGYSAEQEFRVSVNNRAIFNVDDKYFQIYIDLHSLLDKVVISPWAGEWQINILKRLMNKYGYDPQLISYSKIKGAGGEAE